MVPCHLQQENLFRLSHYKTHWTMTLDNVGLKFYGYSYIMFFLDVNWSGLETSSTANDRS